MKATSKHKEYMFHIDYRMHQLEEWIIDLELESKGLCSMKSIEIYNQMKQWDQFILKNN